MKKIISITISSIFALFLFSCSNGQNDSNVADNQTTLTEHSDSEAQIINQQKNNNMKFELIKLPYATDALEPVISKRTIELHHGKHHQTYVNNLNKQIEGTEFADKELVDIVKEAEGGIFNNAGQTLNHNLYFTQFAPNAGQDPKDEIGKAIDRDFGSFAKFKEEFTKNATALFGSGWCWLAADKSGKLVIDSYSNAGNPVVKDLTPLMGIDVWEHAYYLDYENKRGDHIDNVWKIIDWNVVNDRYINR